MSAGIVDPWVGLNFSGKRRFFLDAATRDTADDKREDFRLGASIWTIAKVVPEEDQSTQGFSILARSHARFRAGRSVLDLTPKRRRPLHSPHAITHPEPDGVPDDDPAVIAAWIGRGSCGKPRGRGGDRALASCPGVKRGRPEE